MAPEKCSECGKPLTTHDLVDLRWCVAKRERRVRDELREIGAIGTSNSGISTEVIMAPDVTADLDLVSRLRYTAHMAEIAAGRGQVKRLVAAAREAADALVLQSVARERLEQERDVARASRDDWKSCAEEARSSFASFAEHHAATELTLKAAEASRDALARERDEIERKYQRACQRRCPGGRRRR